MTPTGIDYLRLIQDRHTQALGERLRYAQLTHPADPPADAAGLEYDTDLLALAHNPTDSTDSTALEGL